MFGGLSGMIIVQGLTELLPPDLRDIEDIALGLKDAQVVGDDIEADNIDSNAPTLPRRELATSSGAADRAG